MRRSKLYPAILAMCLTPAVALSGVVAPGGSAGNVSADLVAPSGAPLAEKTVPFSLDYGAAVPSEGFSGHLNGTLRSAVYQDVGGLTFLYSVSLLPDDFISGAGEASALTASSFKSFATNISGALQFEDLVQVARSADGSKVMVKSDTPGLGGAPTLVIRTDAKKFANTGTVNFLASDEVPDPTGDTRLASGQVNLTGAFQPVGGAAGSPTPIPLPPAAYSGMGALLVLAIFGWSRKTRVRFI